MFENFNLNQLKQIGIAAAQYSQDYDERLVPATTLGFSRKWYDNLAPYMKSLQILFCPHS